MPRLLSVNNYHYRRGGAEAIYFGHAELLEHRGWENVYFSMNHPENVPSATQAYFADRVDFGANGGAIQTLKSSARVIYSIQAQRRLSALLTSHPVDIAHFHCIYHHLSPSVLVEAKRRGLPTVLTAHDLKLACPNYKMMAPDGICERCKGGKVWNVAKHRCIKDSLAASSLVMVESAVHKALHLYRRHLDKIITPSAFYRQKLIEWGWPAEKLVHIPNFINDIPNRPAAPGTYLLFFGRLAPEKGLTTLIRAAAKAGVHVKIAGTGPEHDKLVALAHQMDAPVEFVGFKSGASLWELVANAKAIVLPSEWYENGPMSVIEAFGHGKPLIGARIGGIPELIEETVTGWSFASGNADDLAEKLDRASHLPAANLASMADATHNLVRQKFSADAYFQAISAVYRDLGVAT